MGQQIDSSKNTLDGPIESSSNTLDGTANRIILKYTRWDRK